MTSALQTFLRYFPAYRRLEAENRTLAAERDALQARVREWAGFVPPGHFYSPLPSAAEIAEAFSRNEFGPPFGGIDLNEAAQLARLERFAGYYPEQPFSAQPVEGQRFFGENPSYGFFDAIMLYGMIREARPRRIIEVGSGLSSAAMLDLNSRLFDGSMALTFIDPDMTRLRQLLRPDDTACCTLIEKRVQEVDLDVFRALEENDILFIDSSHVSKIGSDVNRLLFDVLPLLRAGVLVHIHDIAGNLEYPREWLEEGRAWNEQYILRAFLMYNAGFRIELFSGWLFNTQHEFLRTRMPLCARGGGGQLWLRRLPA